jgi:hypothetical protein
MTDSDIRKFIRDEIDRKVNVILHGDSGSNTKEAEDIQNLYPGQPTITSRPVMHPFGFVSRAVAGTIQVIGRIGAHTGNRFVLGHRDKNRPDGLEEGECAIYSLGTYEVRIFNTKVQVGKGGTFETLVVGETLRDFLKEFIQIYVAHKHIGNLGFYTTVPDNQAQATQLKTNNLDNDKILAKDSGRF